MTRRFTVIQGGLGAGAAAPESTDPAPAWRVDLCRPGGLDAGTVEAWRALMDRAGVADPLRDPDHLLPLARHQPAGERVALALIWNGPAGRADSLRAAVPLAMPHPVWGRSAASWQPAGTMTTLVVEPGAAEAAEAALRGRLRALRRPLRLASLPVPDSAFVGVRPEGWEPPEGAESVSVEEPAAVRDAVERFLALDARTAPAPIVADPSEASLVRVVSRLFARRRACRVELFRRAGALVAGTLHLGTGPAAVAWRRARA